MNRFTKYVLTSLAFTILMGTFALWTAPQMVAQVKAALVRDIDNPARNAVQFELCNRLNGCGNYVVPAGKILVIEECSSANTLSGAYGVATTVNGNSETHLIPVFPGGGGYIGGRTTRIYASPGTTVLPQTFGGFGPNPELKCSGNLVAQ